MLKPLDSHVIAGDALAHATDDDTDRIMYERISAREINVFTCCALSSLFCFFVGVVVYGSFE